MLEVYASWIELDWGSFIGPLLKLSSLQENGSLDWVCEVSFSRSCSLSL